MIGRCMGDCAKVDNLTRNNYLSHTECTEHTERSMLRRPILKKDIL